MLASWLQNCQGPRTTAWILSEDAEAIKNMWFWYIFYYILIYFFDEFDVGIAGADTGFVQHFQLYKSNCFFPAYSYHISHILETLRLVDGTLEHDLCYPGRHHHDPPWLPGSAVFHFCQARSSAPLIAMAWSGLLRLDSFKQLADLYRCWQ